MKQLTYRATIGGEHLVIRFARGEFETVDPSEAMLDDPPRCAGAAGAHAWYAVVLAWHRRGDHGVRWHRDVVREIVGDARRRWADGAEAHQRHPIHVFQDAARESAERHYPPPAPRAAVEVELPPALRGSLLRPPARRLR
ncbi:hypothetical protein [Patulibacter sp.]|uniref:hypothetical protein n=1 Tax=Patulibacter sp. TaxID=1912859 RepID=UPI00271EC2BC|nr:hypothetical protein [Patulibacter sp.]MDO9408284.1 hypothetical protein [Patulibacter sp.]